MNPDTQRRLKPFVSGAIIGTVLSIILFSVWQKSESGPTSDEKVVVAISKCDLKKGDALEERCVEHREVASRFVPPGTLRASSVQPHLGRKLLADLPTGNAIREEDLN
jgi:hypothetical protein